MPPAQTFSALAPGTDPHQLVNICLRQFNDELNFHAGIIAVNDALADRYSDILRLLEVRTGVSRWYGSLCSELGVDRQCLKNEPGMAVLLSSWDEPTVGSRDRLIQLRFSRSDWKENASQNSFGASHRPTSLSRTTTTELLDEPLTLPENAVVAGYAQGVARLGEALNITAHSGNVVLTLNNKAALTVFRQNIGELLLREETDITDFVFAGLLHADDAAEQVEIGRLLAVDENRGALATSSLLDGYDRLQFCRRDGNVAQDEFSRVLTQLMEQIETPPRAALLIHSGGEYPTEFALSQLESLPGNPPVLSFATTTQLYRGKRMQLGALVILLK